MAHVFISYVRENKEQADKLYETLSDADIEVWLDRQQIPPGTRWKQAIRDAIESGSFFLACFSSEYQARDRSHMNEELTFAIEELRKRPRDRAWFIPVLLSECKIPNWSIGAGDTLRDLQWINLGDDWDEGIRQLLQTIPPSARKQSEDDAKVPDHDSDDSNLPLDSTQPLPYVKGMYTQTRSHAAWFLSFILIFLIVGFGFYTYPYIQTFFLSDPNENGYTLNSSAINGSINREPDKAFYKNGETVVLEALPDPNYSFSGWLGDLTATDNPITLTMDGNKKVIASFAAHRYVYIYDNSISETMGSVTKSPDKESYYDGETVTLSATPGPGYTFSSWSGDISGYNNPVIITLDGNKSIMANFSALTYTLSLDANHGTVSIDPTKSFFNHGEIVTLTAAPETGYEFLNWSGDISGTSATTKVVMDSNKSITANFGLVSSSTYSLSVQAENGTVTKFPDLAVYEEGATVVLTASADEGYEFSGWTGDLSGSENPVTITINADKQIVATFAVIAIDTSAPAITSRSPEADAILVPINPLLNLRIADAVSGVKASSVSIKLDGTTIYSDDTVSYNSTLGICSRTGSCTRYQYSFHPDNLYNALFGDG